MKKRISIIMMIMAILISLIGTLCYASEIQPRTATNTDAINTDKVESTTSTDDEINLISNTDLSGNDDSNYDTSLQDYDITQNDLYVFEGQDYEMDKIIDGNAYIFVNGDLKFSGAVNGSVFIIANGTVEFTEDSNICDSLYIMAPEVKINGAVYDVYGLTDKFEMMQHAYVSRDIRVISQEAKLRGNIYRDVYLTAYNIDVKDDANSLLLGGDFNYSSEKEVDGLQDVVTYGEIKFNLIEKTENEVSMQERIMQYASSAVTSIVYVLVIYFILILIAPKFVERVGKDLKEKTILPFIVGLVSWVAIVFAIVISFMLLVTSFGSAITIIAWYMIFGIIYISSAVFSISILDIIKSKVAPIKENKALEILTLAGIALVVWILQKLPFVGGLLSFVILTMGIGLIVRNIIANKKLENTTEQASAE